MPRPVMYYSAIPGAPGVKQISDADLQYAAHQTLVNFAASDTGVGTLSVNPGVTTGLTLIGTFTDTRRPYNIGDSNAGTNIVSTTYNFYQDRQTVSNSPSARPVEFQTGASTGFKEQPDSEISNFIANTACSLIAGGGLGSYRLQSAAPVGTWVSKATITNQISGNTVITSANTFLWRRTDITVPTVLRPLKYQSGANRGLKQMTDAELQSLNTYTRNRIVSSAVGTYLLQTATPTPGTWVDVGSVTDTRQQIAPQNYTGAYTGGTYIGSYNQNFTGTYNQNFTAFYGGFAGITYVGSFTGLYTGTFTGPYTGGSYTGVYTSDTIQATTESVSTVTLWLRTA